MRVPRPHFSMSAFVDGDGIEAIDGRQSTKMNTMIRRSSSSKKATVNGSLFRYSA